MVVPHTKLKLLLVVFCIFEMVAYNGGAEGSVAGNGSTASFQEAIAEIGQLFNRPFNEIAYTVNLPAILLSILTTSPTAPGTNVNKELEAMKGALGTIFTANEVGTNCQSDVFDVVDGFSSGESWALQLLDSYGKPGADMLQGNLRWFGNYQECLDFYITPANMHLDRTNPTGFETKYCRVSMAAERFLPADIQIFTKHEGFPDVTVGTCQPTSCNPADISGMIIAFQTLLNVTKVLSPTVQCVENEELGTGGTVGICILAVIGSLILIGTLYDIAIVQMQRAANSKTSVNHVEKELDGHNVNPDEVKENGHDQNQSLNRKYTGNNVQNADAQRDNCNKNDISHLQNRPSYRIVIKMGREDIGNFDDGKSRIEYVNEGFASENTRGLTTGSAESESVDIPNEVSYAENSEDAETPMELKSDKVPGILTRLVLAFSVYTNGFKLLSTNHASGSITSVNGIRFLSMCWVILGHTILLTPNFSNNSFSYGVVEGAVLGRWTFLAIINAFFCVDTFFTLSGLLVAYITLKELDKRGGAKKLNWVMFYFLRIWRLTPAYMLVLMVAFVIYPLLVDGPMKGMFSLTRNCEKTWWTNLLYVNNLVGDNVEEIDGMCMGWSWYLANDMQFYIVSPLMIVPLFYNMYAGIASCLIFLSVTTGLSAYITYTHEYRAQRFSPFLPTPNDPYYFWNVYIPCYTRIGPYIVGIFTGYLLYKWKCECKINKVLNAALWLSSFGLCCTILYGVYNDVDSNIFTLSEVTAYWALSRTGWGVGVSWIVFACATGNGGWINDLLSWKAFVPLGRLTYCTYLIHPVVMWAYYEELPQPFMFSDSTFAYLFVGHTVLSYGAAFITCLAFESPMMGLGKVLFQKK